MYHVPDQAAFIPDWALEMEHRRIEVERRHTAAIETVASSLVAIQQQLVRLIDHLTEKQT